MTDEKEKRIRARACVRGLSAYSEEADPGVNLSNNTNLFGANPALARALEEAKTDAYRDYPSLTSRDLREALAKHHGVSPEAVVTGNGSNELIDGLIRTFADPGERVAFHPPTFSMIPFFIAAHDAKAAAVPLSRENAFRLPVEDIVATDARVTFVCTPNNPTGNAFPRDDVLRVVDESDGVVVVDEAYVEFGDDTSLAAEVERHENLVVLRTFSKAYGLAGLRVGYAVAPPALAEEIAKVRGPFRLNAFSERAATLALDEDAYLRHVVDTVRAERARLADALRDRGFHVYPSDANFLLMKPPVAAKALAAALDARGLHVRDFGGDLADLIRVTVGPPEVTDQFLDALDASLAEVTA